MANKYKNQKNSIKNLSNININAERFVSSSLFNETLVLRDIKREMKHYWENEETSGFYEFWTNLCHFAYQFNDLDKDQLGFNETFESLILPVFEILGYLEVGNDGLENYDLDSKIPFVESGVKKSMNVPLLIFNSKSDKDLINDLVETDNEDIYFHCKKMNILPVVYDYYDSLSDERNGEYDELKGMRSFHRSSFQNMSGNNTCVEITKHISKVGYGIVTDGAKWRLINSHKTNEDSEVYYEFNIAKFLELFEGSNVADIEENEEFLEASKWFFWFFSKKGVLNNGLSFLSEVELKSKRYKEIIEEDLKTRFVNAVTIITNGFEGAKKANENEIRFIVKTAESLVFNLFFLRSCESKGVIPFHQGYKRISLANVINKIANYDPRLSWSENSLQLKSLETIFEKELKEDGGELKTHLMRLFEIVKNGEQGFGVHAFVESIFGVDEYKYFEENKLQNRTVLALLHELMFFKDQGSLKQIPYNSFSPRQLGSIFESFLEFQPKKADKNYYYLKKKSERKVTWQWVEKSKIPSTINIESLLGVKKGEYIFSPNNKERKTTGSYYTPHVIVEQMVKDSLEEKVKGIDDARELLKLRVCDLSMGSGHFLVEALNYLSKEYQKLQSTYVPESEIRREVLDSCIYGADINESAVKLSKMSLWLSSAYAGKKLEKLSDQIFYGDALLDISWKEKMVDRQGKSFLFDAIIGNPPYIRNTSLTSRQKAELPKFYEVCKKPSFHKGAFQFDICVAFYELAGKLVKNDIGVVSYICSNKFMFKDYGVNVRKYLRDDVFLEYIVDVSQLNVFEDASTYPYIFRFKPSSCRTEKVKIYMPNSQEEYLNSNFRSVEIDRDDVESWLVFEDFNLSFVEKIKNICINGKDFKRGVPQSKLNSSNGFDFIRSNSFWGGNLVSFENYSYKSDDLKSKNIEEFGRNLLVVPRTLPMRLSSELTGGKKHVFDRVYYTEVEGSREFTKFTNVYFNSWFSTYMLLYKYANDQVEGGYWDLNGSMLKGIYFPQEGELFGKAEMIKKSIRLYDAYQKAAKDSFKELSVLARKHNLNKLLKIYPFEMIAEKVNQLTPDLELNTKQLEKFNTLTRLEVEFNLAVGNILGFSKQDSLLIKDVIWSYFPRKEDEYPLEGEAEQDLAA